MRFPYESDEAAQLNRDIFETIYFGAVEASMEIAAKDGPYSTFEGSPMSKVFFSDSCQTVGSIQFSRLGSRV
jgi:ribonucleotide reductase alpha subunit